MCTGTRYLYICRCYNKTCPQRQADPLSMEKCNPGQGHIVRVEHDTTSWVYCSKWFQQQPPEILLNAYVSPDGRCPVFDWEDSKKATKTICNECTQEKPLGVKPDQRHKDPRVAIPLSLMPKPPRPETPFDNQKQTPVPPTRHTMHWLEDQVNRSYEDSSRSATPIPREETPKPAPPPPAKKKVVHFGKSLGDLMEEVEEQNGYLGSRVLAEDSTPLDWPDSSAVGTHGAPLYINPFGAIGQEKKARQGNPFGVIGQEREAARRRKESEDRS